jgi:hypothetical protein
MHYVSARALDKAGNVSLGHAHTQINYTPERDSIAQGETHIYRYTLTEGEALTVDLEVMSGDADLYVWSSQAVSSKWVSNRAEGNEQVIIPADEVVAGTYQVEVHGLRAAEYRLQVNADPAAMSQLQATAEVSQFTDATKEQPEQPVVPVDSLPEEDWMGMPPLPTPPGIPNTQTSLYLPLVVRQ